MPGDSDLLVPFLTNVLEQRSEQQSSTQLKPYDKEVVMNAMFLKMRALRNKSALRDQGTEVKPIDRE